MTEVDVFLQFPCFLCDPANVGNLISGSSSFSKPSLDIWNVLVRIMLQLSMQDFKHDLTSMGDECNCPMVSTFFSTTLLGNWDKDWPFPVLWPLLGLPDLLIYWMQHLDGITLLGFESIFYQWVFFFFFLIFTWLHLLGKKVEIEVIAIALCPMLLLFGPN